jgi:hypothetical protein
MRRLTLVALLVAALAALGRVGTSSDDLENYSPLTAAPDYHTPLLENAFVLVLDVSIPPGTTVPVHLHPWPAVFITLQPAHLVFRNLAAEIVREVRPPNSVRGDPKVEWRDPDSEPASVTNVGATALRALRIELKFLAR